MPSASVPVSLRLSPDDAQWLADQDLGGANSLGEKLRALLRESRSRAAGDAPADYAGWLARMTARVDGPVQALRQAEFATGIHSELLARFGAWLPETLAYCQVAMPQADADPEALLRFEAGVAERLGVLAQQLLQLALTTPAPTYDPALPDTVSGPLVELAEAVRGRKGKKKQKK